MKKYAVLLAVLMGVFSFQTNAQDLKPAQEEAKDLFDKEMQDPIKRLNEKCGAKVNLKADFQNFNVDKWAGTSAFAYCKGVPEAIIAMCEKPSYQKAIAKQLNTISCLFTGYKAGERNNETTQKNMSFNKGHFIFNMAKDGVTNIEQNTTTVIENAFK